jgi:hypothetical protein
MLTCKKISEELINKEWLYGHALHTKAVYIVFVVPCSKCTKYSLGALHFLVELKKNNLTNRLKFTIFTL